MMRFILALLLAVVGFAASAAGPVVVINSAQDHAVVLARRGVLVHSNCNQYEGIGFSTKGPTEAARACCFWGRRTPVDIGTAWSPIRRGWYAVVRYR